MLISSTWFERASETLLRHLAQLKGDHLFRLALFNGDGRASKPAAAVGRTKSNNRRVAWQKRKRVSRSRKSWKAPNRSCVPSDSLGIRRVEHKKFGSCFERLAAPRAPAVPVLEPVPKHVRSWLGFRVRMRPALSSQIPLCTDFATFRSIDQPKSPYTERTRQRGKENPKSADSTLVQYFRYFTI